MQVISKCKKGILKDFVQSKTEIIELFHLILPFLDQPE